MTARFNLCVCVNSVYSLAMCPSTQRGTEHEVPYNNLKFQTVKIGNRQLSHPVPTSAIRHVCVSDVDISELTWRGLRDKQHVYFILCPAIWIWTQEKHEKHVTFLIVSNQLYISSNVNINILSLRNLIFFCMCRHSVGSLHTTQLFNNGGKEEGIGRDSTSYLSISSLHPSFPPEAIKGTKWK